MPRPEKKEEPEVPVVPASTVPEVVETQTVSTPVQSTVSTGRKSWDIVRFGDVIMSPKAAFIALFYKTFSEVRVDVPVQVANSLILFDFEHQMQRFEELKLTSDKTVDTMMTFIARLLNDFDDKNLQDILKKRGIDTNDTDIGSIVSRLRTRMLESITKSGLPSIIIKNSLERPEIMSQLRDAEMPDMMSLSSTIHGVQELYGKFALSAAASDIASFISVELNEKPGFALIRGIYKMFHGPGVQATAPGRLNYVLDTIMTGFKEVPLVTFDEDKDVPGIRRHISGVNMLADGITYGDMMAGYFHCIRTIMGFEGTTEDVGQISLRDMVTTLTTGIGEFMPFVPSDVGDVSMDRIDETFSKMWFLFAIKRIATNDFGMTAGRIDRIKDQRKYTREDEFESIIKEGINVSSIIFDSYVDTAAFLRMMVEDESIKFENIHPTKRKQLTSFIFKISDNLKSTTVSIEAPNFLSSAIHILDHRFSPDVAEVGFIVKDSMNDMTVNSLYDKTSLMMEQYAVNKHIQGSIIDMGITELHPSLLNSLMNTNKIEVFYSIKTPNHALLAEFDVLREGVSILFLADVLNKAKDKGKYHEIVDWLMGHSQFENIRDKYDFMDTFQLPIEMADALFKGKGVYLRFNDVSSTTLTWDPMLAPIFETKNIDFNNYHIKPVLTHFPFLMKRTMAIPYVSIRQFTGSQWVNGGDKKKSAVTPVVMSVPTMDNTSAQVPPTPEEPETPAAEPKKGKK